MLQRRVKSAPPARPATSSPLTISIPPTTPVELPPPPPPPIPNVIYNKNSTVVNGHDVSGASATETSLSTEAGITTSESNHNTVSSSSSATIINQVSTEKSIHPVSLNFVQQTEELSLSSSKLTTMPTLPPPVQSTTTVTSSSFTKRIISQPPASMPMATVVRRTFGTGPFDKIWLNKDCCGLFCAGLTYALHIYGSYAVTWVLLPPWMSNYYSNSLQDYVDYETVVKSENASKSEIGVDVIRCLSLWGKFHTTLFVVIAALAVTSHVKAMTTNPGAVPPDAEPIPDFNSNSNSSVNSSLDTKHHGGGSTSTTTTTMTTTSNNNGSTSSTTTSTTTNDTTHNNNNNSVELNPLIPKSSNIKNNSSRPKRICRRCNTFKPDRAHHCSICKRCIIKMDHHCPWVNNCVGIGNHKYFLLFVLYTFISCTYAVSLVVLRFFSCLHTIDKHHHHRHDGTSCLDQPTHLIVLIGLLVESMLFGTFTACMMIDQWDVVLTNVTHIDKLKGINSSTSSGGVNEVFGAANGPIMTYISKRKWLGGFLVSRSSASSLQQQQQASSSAENTPNFRPDWLSPFAKVCFPESIRDEIMGFCTPCGSHSSSAGGGGGGSSGISSVGSGLGLSSVGIPFGSPRDYMGKKDDNYHSYDNNNHGVGSVSGSHGTSSSTTTNRGVIHHATRSHTGRRKVSGFVETV